jgi:hypothetical protein
VGGVTELWTLTIFVTGIRGHTTEEIVPYVKLIRPDGVEIPSNANMNAMSTARVRVIVGLDELEGLDKVILKDGPSGVEIPIDLPPPLTIEEATAQIAYAKGGPNWNRLAEGGDHTGIFFGLYDAQDRLLSPEPALVYIEADGAEIMGPLKLAFGRYQLLTLMETLPGITEGEIRVYASDDDRLLGAFPFMRRSVGGWGVTPEMSTVEMVAVNDLWGSGVTHDVVVRVANPFGEVLGANAAVEVEVVQFGELLEIHLSSNGNWIASLQANTGKGVLEADVYIEGSYFDTVSMETNIPVPPKPPGEDEPEEPPVEEEPPIVEEEAPVDIETPGEPEAEGPVPATDDGGCVGAGGVSSTFLWWFFPGLACWLWRRRLRRAWPTRAVGPGFSAATGSSPVSTPCDVPCFTR